jgi:hypothetical protein
MMLPCISASNLFLPHNPLTGFHGPVPQVKAAQYAACNGRGQPLMSKTQARQYQPAPVILAYQVCIIPVKTIQFILFALTFGTCLFPTYSEAHTGLVNAAVRLEQSLCLVLLSHSRRLEIVVCIHVFVLVTSFDENKSRTFAGSLPDL